MGRSPFIPFSLQAVDRSPGNEALDFCFLLGNAKREDKPGRARQNELLQKIKKKKFVMHRKMEHIK
jgi:hypothetical protein